MFLLFTPIMAKLTLPKNLFSGIFTKIFHFTKTELSLIDVVIFISMVITSTLLIIFKKEIDKIIRNSILKFFNRYLFIIFPASYVILFLLGIFGFDYFYKYAYWGLFFTITVLYSSIVLKYVIRKVLINFRKGETDKNSSEESKKKVHFVNLFISSFLTITINALSILAMILVWTIPFGIIHTIFSELNIVPIEITKTLINKLIHLTIIFFIGGLVIYISKIVGDNIYHLVEDANIGDVNNKEARAKTLINVINNIIKVAVFVFISFSVLQEMGINITTLLAGAGIVGIAIGFGAQSLIKDFFSGFFILFENQYTVGDVVKIGEISGLVERITLRITVLRNLEGIVHIIPNGNITTVSNMTYEWSRSVIDINISYKENIDGVFDILKKLSDEFYNDLKWQPLMVSKPEVWEWTD